MLTANAVVTLILAYLLIGACILVCWPVIVWVFFIGTRKLARVQREARGA